MKQEDRIISTIDYIDRLLTGTAKCTAEELMYYPGCCKKKDSDTIAMMMVYQNTLITYITAQRNGLTPCLESTTVDTLLGKAATLTGACPPRPPVEIQDGWKVDSPCIPYQEWEKCLYGYCEITYDVTFLKSCLDSKEILEIRAIISPLQAFIDTCRLNLTVEPASDCEIQWKAYVESTDCSVSFDAFQQVIRCGIEYNVITDLAKCGVTINYNITKQCPELQIGSTNYPVCDIEDIGVVLTPPPE